MKTKYNSKIKALMAIFLASFLLLQPIIVTFDASTIDAGWWDWPEDPDPDPGPDPDPDPDPCQDECSYYGQKECTDNTHYHQCGNYDCDTCLEWSSPYSCPSGKVCSNGQCVSSCQDECSYYGQTEKQCSGNYVQKRTCGNYDSDTCLEWTSWSNLQNCGSDSWTDNYQCSGTWVQRQKTLKGCSNGSCYENTQWVNQTNCADQGKVCSNGQCITQCISHDYEQCYDNDVYWYDSCDQREDKSEECGDDGWTNNYRCYNSRYLQKEWKDRGCSNASCFANSEWITQEDCGTDSWTDNYRCDGTMVQREKTLRGCSNLSCYANNQWFNEYDCADQGMVCSNGQCVETCQDECSYEGATTCHDDNSKKTCGYYDSDSCLEWSNPQSCGTDTCIGSTYRDYCCSGGDCYHNDNNCDSQCYFCGDGVCNSECGEDSCNCKKDCGSGEEEDIISGNLISNKNYACTGDRVDITISAQDDQGVEKVSLYYSGSWHNESCSNNTSCSKTWSIYENNPGYYNYTGMVYGKKLNSSSEEAYTNPSTITIHFDDCVDECVDECAYSGQVRCSGYASRQTCGNYDSDSCLEWSNSESCQGSTYCGYGKCDEDERPEWYCSGGYCYYNCNYSSSCDDHDDYDEHDYKNCYKNDVYWYDSDGDRNDKYEECGDSSCNSWDYYCIGDKVYKKRICYERGCKNDKCYEEKETEKKYIKTCDGNCEDGECVEECECDSGICCDGCNYREDDFICDSDRYIQYGCPWGAGCGSDVGVRTKIKFRYCSGDDNQCTGDWDNWGSWGSWRVNDYCSNSETCSVGNATCNYNPNCQSQPVYTNYKQCYDDDVYWFRSDGTRLSKYMECDDENSCTIDNCSGDRCLHDLKCDGSTCALDSDDYCTNCTHCGDNVCNCKEDFCSCPADCKLPSAEGLAVSALVRLKGEDNPWKKEISVQPEDDLSFMIVVATPKETVAENIILQNQLPQNINFVGNLEIDNSFSGGDLFKGISLGTLPGGESKIITFDAQIKEGTNFSLGSTYLNNLVTVNYDEKIVYESIGIEVIKIEGVAAAGSLFSQVIKIVGSLAFWLVILFLIILIIIVSLMSYYFFVKRKQVQVV